MRMHTRYEKTGPARKKQISQDVISVWCWILVDKLGARQGKLIHFAFSDNPYTCRGVKNSGNLSMSARRTRKQ